MQSPIHISVFLASPSDLQAERRIARDVVDRVNRSAGRRLGWHFDLLGWEDTLPGLGRPQELINRDVDACDLFVGLLHKRWGSPTGGFSSGFEEEFNRARDRWSSKGVPEIWLFFKSVPDELLRDPGEQLRHVVAFKEDQTARGDLFYKEFDASEEWAQVFFEYLVAYVAELHKDRSRAETEPQSPAEGSSPGTATGVADDELSIDAARAQVIELAGKSVSALKDGRVPSEVLSRFELARLYVAPASWVSYTQTGELLSAHVLNTLYEGRDGLALSMTEGRLIQWTMMEESGENVPGWYWFRMLSAEQQATLIAATALAARNTAARVSALNLMSSARLDVPEGRRAEFLDAVLEASDSSLRRAGFQYVGEMGVLADISRLEDLMAREATLTPLAITAKLRILTRSSPLEAFELLVDDRAVYVPDEVVDALRQTSFRSPRGLGMKGLAHNRADVRRLSLEKLDVARALTKDAAVHALADGDFEVRRTAIRIILKRQWKVDVAAMVAATDTEDSGKHNFRDRLTLIEEIYATRSKEELVSMIDWFNPIEGIAAFPVLALNYFAEVEETIRDDLRNGFARLKEEAESKLVERFDASVAAAFAERFSTLDDFVKDILIAGSLRALARHGSAQDLPLIKGFLTSDDVATKEEAIATIQNLGSEEDAQDLIPLVDDYLVGDRAVKAALALSPGASGVAAQLIDHPKAEVVVLAIRTLFNDEEAQDLVRPALWHKELPVRRAAVAYFVSVKGRSDLQKLLDEYYEHDTYYYNVPHFIDRLLYTKGPLRRHFKSRVGL